MLTLVLQCDSLSYACKFYLYFFNFLSNGLCGEVHISVNVVLVREKCICNFCFYNLFPILLYIYIFFFLQMITQHLYE